MAVYKFLRKEFDHTVRMYLYTTLTETFPHLCEGNKIGDTPIQDIGEDLAYHLGDLLFEAGSVPSIEVHTPTKDGGDED